MLLVYAFLYYDMLLISLYMPYCMDLGKMHSLVYCKKCNVFKGLYTA